MDTEINRQSLLAALRQRGPRSMHVVELCEALGVPPYERDRILNVLDEAIELGFAVALPGNRFRAVKRKAARAEKQTAAPPPAEDGLTGRLIRNPRGFGFVHTGDGQPDVFIPPSAMKGAMHGDRVEVRAWQGKKGRDGEVVNILERGAELLTGTLHRHQKDRWFEPDDRRLPGRMLIHGRIPREARGQKTVVARFHRYPRNDSDFAVIEVIDVLGSIGETGVEVAKIKLREGIIEAFPPSVSEEAESIPNSVPAHAIEGRVDLRGLDIVTIDPSDARDHDDAIFIERMQDGTFHVVIAIADVSYYVTPETSIDQEALRRGCSIYLPDRAIPMLPAELSSGLASLVPDEDRLAMAVEITLDSSSKVISHRFIEAIIRSKARLTYGGVARALGLSSEPVVEPAAESRRESLRHLRELSGMLRTRRMRRGSLDFDLPEPRILLDEDEREPLDSYRAKRDPGIQVAYTLVEEMMLLANQLVAETMVQAGLPSIFRVHGNPLSERIAVFAEVAVALGFELSLEEATNPKSLAAFLRTVRGEEQAPILSYLLLRSMQQATYDTRNIGHFGLALKDYVHFTSPIRRYPDLIVHRVLRSHLRGEKIDTEAMLKELTEAAKESSWLERRAMSVERDVVNLYRTILMRDRIGEEFEAKVTGLKERGVYVTFDDPYVEAFIPSESLGDDFELDRLGLHLSGATTGLNFRLGDTLKVRLEEASLENRQLLVMPVGHRPGHTRPTTESGQKKRDPRRSGERRQGRRPGPESPTKKKKSKKFNSSKKRGRRRRK